MNKTITILIADDNHYMRETLRYLISRVEEYEVIAEAVSGQEAIQKALELQPDILLIDINMAPINGFEATRKITRSNKKIKIIGLSVHRQISYAQNIISLGAKGYITKSSSPKEILKAIQIIAEGGEYICEELQ